MRAARERLERINQLRLGDGDVDFLVVSLRRALDALEKVRSAEVNGVSNVAGFAIEDIDALAKEGTGKP